MNFESLLNAARSTASGAFQSAAEVVETATSTFGSGLGYAKHAVASSWLFGSNETLNSVADEKHYFLIPYRLAECGYTLYSMRCLPEGVPPVNELPKKRVFHLPNEHASKMVEQMLLDEAAATVAARESEKQEKSSLIDLADRIDKLDQKAFNGALLIGGLVALANPVAGGMLAAKAMIPSIGLLLTKYGLKQAGETLDERNLAGKIKRAEKGVLTEFHGTSTAQVVDPLLAQLDKALNTDAFEYDPLVDEPLEDEDEAVEDRGARLLTMRAIVNTYQELLSDQRLHSAAGLGPEDIRWLQYLATIQKI